MKTNARRAFPAWAMPGLVSLLVGASVSAYAAEGPSLPPPTQFAALQAALPAPPPAIQPPAIQPAAILPLATPGRPTAQPATATPRTTPSTPAPRPIAAGPVWTDATGSWRQVGIASWYGGRRWQGRLTAAGVRYDERQLTAAHASLPLGSQVRVTVADSGRTVMVTINDRPGTRKRIIDLSRAAAEELGIVERGVARVTLTPS